MLDYVSVAHMTTWAHFFLEHPIKVFFQWMSKDLKNPDLYKLLNLYGDMIEEIFEYLS